MGYCHCASCRAWSAGPVNAFTLWKPDNVLVTKGAELLGRVQRIANSERRWCTQCGGHVLTHHPVWGITDVYAATLPSVVFSPGVHVNYGETVLPMRDGAAQVQGLPRGARRLRRDAARVARARSATSERFDVLRQAAFEPRRRVGPEAREHGAASPAESSR